jgi:DNA primase
MNLQSNYIKKYIQPVDFYQQQLPSTTFKRNRWNVAGCCPFHDDRNPGSFHVNIQTGAFKCFSCGVAGGDIIAYTMAFHGLGFSEAINQLSMDWGL